MLVPAAVLAIIAAIGAVALWVNRLPVLTEEAVAAAARRWEESGVGSYVMDLEISGARAGNVHVEVQNGVVVELVRDGHTPRERRTWDAWSVPGQFDMIRRGLEVAENPAREMQAEQGTQVLLRGRFDPELGYPLAFSQVTLGGGPEFAWRTVRFELR